MLVSWWRATKPRPSHSILLSCCHQPPNAEYNFQIRIKLKQTPFEKTKSKIQPLTTSSLSFAPKILTFNINEKPPLHQSNAKKQANLKVPNKHLLLTERVEWSRCRRYVHTTERDGERQRQKTKTQTHTNYYQVTRPSVRLMTEKGAKGAEVIQIPSHSYSPKSDPIRSDPSVRP